MSSKAQRRKRAKRSRTISLPGGEVVAHKATQGRREIQEDPRKVVIDARVRVFGVTAEDATAAMHGSQAGCCIANANGDASAMWQAWQDIDAARRNYRLRNGIQDGPKCATIAMVPDAMQTDTSLTVDIRTAEEKDASAKRAWATWQGRINALPSLQMRWAIKNALDGGINGQGGELWRDGMPTDRGRVFIAALSVLMK